MAGCNECGLVEKMGDGGERCCLKLRRPVSDAGTGDCPYFMPIQCDGGEPLTPQQHLILKERELSSKKMRGPV